MPDNTHVKAHKTKPEDKVPVFQKISYGIGLASDHFATVSISAFLMAFFTDFLNAGIKASIVGAAIAVARLWDAFTDPAAGRLSDGCKSKWGRRKPFILIGSLTMGLFFSLGLSRYISSLLFELSPFDPVTLVGVVFLISAIASAACYLPVRSATRIEPMEVLRQE